MLTSSGFFFKEANLFGKRLLMRAADGLGRILLEIKFEKKLQFPRFCQSEKNKQCSAKDNRDVSCLSSICPA